MNQLRNLKEINLIKSIEINLHIKKDNIAQYNESLYDLNVACDVGDDNFINQNIFTLFILEENNILHLRQ